jgi:AraC-like DNA-binding protein
MTSRQRERPRELHDPLATLQMRPLHASAAVNVYDVHCQPSDFGRGPEECSRSDQIVLPRRGVFEREARGERLIAEPNRVLFFSRDEGYRVAHPAGCGDECTVLVFEPQLLREAVQLYDPGWAARSPRPFRFTHALSEPRTLLAVEHWRRAALAASAPRLLLDESALRLLHTLLGSAYRTGPAPERARQSTVQLHRQQVERTALLLAANFCEDLSLEQIARAAHCSAFHLARLFRRHAGLTIHQYRHRLRLREALRRLGDGEHDLSALALGLGFASQSHFSDCFRQAFGVAPGAYRKALSARARRELSKILEVPMPRTL